MTSLVDLDEARRFLDLLDSTEKNWTWQTFDDDKARRAALKKEKKRDPLARILHGTLEARAAELLALNARGAGVYVMVNAGDGQGREKENVTAVRAVFADVDSVPVKQALEAGRLTPHIVVESSPGRWQLCWRVDGLPLDKFRGVQQAIAAKTGSDPSIIDDNRVMRVPGFLHQKGNPFLSRIAHPKPGAVPRAPYTAEQILAAFPPVKHGAHKNGTMDEARHTPLLLDFRIEPVTEETVNDLRSALTFLPADDYGDPTDAGRANKLWSDKAYQLKTLGEPGRTLFHEYSARSAAYDRDACDDIFDRVNPTRTSYKTVFTEARAMGWTNPRKVGSCNKSEPCMKAAETHETLATISAALAILSSDPGALYEPIVIASLRRLHGSDLAEFARVRAKAKDSKRVSMVEFDRATEAEAVKSNDECDLFIEVEPHPEPVDGAELLDDLVATIFQYVIADRATIHATALWIVHSWLIDVATVTPIANITAPEKRCGKTVLLTVLGNLVRRPLQVANVSPAAMFRTLERWLPTLLIDEADSFLHDNEEARGILNSGNTRASAFVLRCDGDDNEPRRFSTWGAKALCGIGKLPDTLTDRSIPLSLRRKKTGDRVENIRHANPTLWENLRSRLARWAADNCHAVAAMRPSLIEGLNDRANDCWEPLLGIASAVGGPWPECARQAALSLHGIEGEAPSMGVELLSNIRDIFEATGVTKIFNAQLLVALTADPELRWATSNRGKVMTTSQLGVRLAAFDIRPHTVRIATESKRGYELKDFADAFSRYLPGRDPDPSGTSAQPSNGAG